MCNFARDVPAGVHVHDYKSVSAAGIGNLLDQKDVPKRGSFLIISAFRIQVFFNLWKY